MIQHQIIALFTKEWYTYTTLCIAAICLLIAIGNRLNKTGKRLLRIGLGISCLSSAILIHPYLMSVDQWSLQNSLPLHMCELSEIFAGIVLIWPNQRLFEILCYWGIPGGFHSILTPELLQKGNDGWLLFHYYFMHTIIMLAPVLLMTMSYMRLRNRSWLRVFLFTNLCLPFIGTINWLLGSNYMYLAEKPIVDNPFIIGDWPWYIIALEFVALIHYYLVFIICTKKIKISFGIFKAKTSSL